MTVTALLFTGSVIIGFLGLVHLLYTFLSNKFEPRDKQLKEPMQQVSPILTAETTIWKAWVGFNASHSLGALLFAAVYGYFALFDLHYLLSSPFLMTLSIAVLVSLLILAKLYWFRIPLFGIAIANGLFVAGYAIGLS